MRKVGASAPPISQSAFQNSIKKDSVVTHPTLHLSVRLALVASACTAMLAAPSLAQAAPQSCTDTIDVQSPMLSDGGFGLNEHNTRNQRSGIHAGNVRKLEVALTHVAPNYIGKRGAVAVTEQTVYLTEGPYVIARNRVSGCEYWRYAASQALIDAVGFTGEVMHSSSVKYLPPKDGKPALIFMGDVVGTVYALNAQTGVPVWGASMATSYPYHMITGGMQVHEGTLFVPVSSREVSAIVSESLTQGKVCCTTHGLLQAVDAYTGQIKWTYHTTGPAALDATTQLMAPSGASVWGTPMVDAERKQVLIGTGQNFSRPTTSTSDAIIALDMGTGAVKWSFQANLNDAYNVACDAPPGYDIACPAPLEANKDFDFGAPPILAPMPLSWGGKAVIAGSKNGVVYSLNPETGRVNWVRRLGVGGSLGGVHWGMAVDKFRVYVGITDLMGDKAKRIEEFQGGVTKGRLSEGAQPGLYSLDLWTGRVMWKKTFKHTYEGAEYDDLFSAGLSVTNDVLFAGSLNGKVRALHTLTGLELWSFDTAIAVTDVDGETGKGGTIDSVGPIPAGNELYLNSGYGTFGNTNAWQAGYGNAMFVFRLKQSPR